MERWHLIYTKPHKEPQVNRLLQERGIETFFPVVQLERGYGRGIRIEPFFPHYLFFRVDLRAANATGLRWLPGVRTIVHFEEQPVVVPESVIEALRQRLEPFENEVLHPGEWFYKPGDRVRITSGPFAGLEGIFQKGLTGRDRVQILLHILGSLTRTEVNISQIEPLDR